MLTIWQTSLRRRFSSLYIGILAATSAGSYLLRDIPEQLWITAKHRAVDEGLSLRELILKALQAYLNNTP